MNILDVKKEGSVYVVTMTAGDNGNSFTADVLKQHEETLDEIEAGGENAALVLTANHEKLWCTGINLDWLVTQPPDYFPEFATLLDRFLFRWAFVNIPTIGCITGHAFAGGALLAATLDFRVMRNDRGWICYPEVDVKIPFTPLMSELIRLYMPPHVLREMALTGKRMGADEAASHGMVEGAYPPDNLFVAAMEIAEKTAAKDRATYTAIKRGLRQSLKPLCPPAPGA